MQKLITSMRIFLIFTVLLGLAYPLFIMFVGQTFFPYQANGSLLKQQEKIVGSALIAQEFTSPKYFHSRFSAINYNATNSGGSNLAVSNTKLYLQVEKHINQVKSENSLPPNTILPADMVLTSASGLDPHISLANAILQLPRVAKHRGLANETVKKMIHSHLDDDFVGVWGQKGVNILQLNLALDKLMEQ